MTGQRFGRWTVLRMAVRTSTDGHKRTACVCRCDCGTERVVYAQSLRSGASKSCGCALPSFTGKRREKAGEVTYSDPVEMPVTSADDWMFGGKGAKGLFRTKRQ